MGARAARVLLVDDSATMRQVLRAALAREDGWEVVGEAVDGEQAVAVAARTAPDVVLLDQQMPRLDGLGALPGLRAACPGAQVFLWSDDPAVADRALAGGARAVLDKAEPLAETLARVRAGLA